MCNYPPWLVIYYIITSCRPHLVWYLVICKFWSCTHISWILFIFKKFVSFILDYTQLNQDFTTEHDYNWCEFVFITFLKGLRPTEWYQIILLKVALNTITPNPNYIEPVDTGDGLYCKNNAIWYLSYFRFLHHFPHLSLPTIDTNIHL